MATSANALYVLRLVLGGAVRRTFSTATAPRQRPFGIPPAPAWPSTTSTTGSSFLEADEGDYEAAAEFLPEREAKEASPVPWPTVFHHAGEPKPHSARPCDLVARLAAGNKLGPARKVADELKALHTPIMHRKMYLPAALASLSPTPEGKRNFLFWLDLYPNRVATLNTPTLRREWEPVAYRLIAEYLDDAKFLGDFLVLAGRKGLLNALFPIMVVPLTATLPPQESEQVVERAIAAYHATCRPATSNSERAQRFRRTVDTQTTQWWNKYLRALTIVGWRDSALALLHSPPEGVRFTRFTRSMVLSQDVTKQARADEARTIKERNEAKALRMANAKRPADVEDALTTFINNPPEGQRLLAKYLSRALDRTQLDLPPVAELADTQRLLISCDRPDLLQAFEDRFLARRADSPTAADVRFQWWAHAEILRYSRDGEHVEAIKAFRRRFLWVGLPATTVGADELAVAARRLPSQRIITSLLPSILALLSGTERQAYLVAYYSPERTLAPILGPNEYTHLAFVRAAGLAGGPSAAMEVIQLISDKGHDPGRPAWSALLLNLMGQGQADAAFEVLSGMEREAPFGHSGFRMPAPSGRTYAGLVRLCVHHGRVDEAVEVLRRFKAYNKEHATDADDAAALEGVENFLAGLQRSSKRRSPEEIAHDVRTQAKVKLEMDRLEGEDLNSRVRMLYERRRRKEAKEAKEESHDEGRAEVKEKDVEGEERQTSAFA